MRIGLRFPLLWQAVTNFWPLGDDDGRRVHEGELSVIDRRNGAFVWRSAWKYEARSDDQTPGGNFWYLNPHPHAVSPDGKRLAEGTCDGYSTTFRFWDLPQRHWPARFANGLGLCVAAAYWWLRRGWPSSLCLSIFRRSRCPSTAEESCLSMTDQTVRTASESTSLSDTKAGNT